MAVFRFNQAVKTDDPYVIVGDPDQTVVIPDIAAEFAQIQGWGTITSRAIPVVSRADAPQFPEPAGVSPALPDDSGEVSSQSPQVPDDGLGPMGDGSLALKPEAPKRPYGNAAKSAWIEYACAVDPELSPDRAEGWTKADLMSRYGERLLYTEGPALAVQA